MSTEASEQISHNSFSSSGPAAALMYIHGVTTHKETAAQSLVEEASV